MGLFDYDRSKEWRNGVYLCSVRGNMEAEIIESKLRSEGIPCIRRYQGSSNYMEILFGRDFANEMDIYVPEETLEDARNIIIPIDLDDCRFDGCEEPGENFGTEEKEIDGTERGE